MTRLNFNDIIPDEQTHKQINSIVSDFLECPSVVTGTAPPEIGRSRDGGRHYRLTVDTGSETRHMSVKLKFNTDNDLNWELLNSDIRQLLTLPHYKVEKKSNFPLPDWQNQDYILMDWGAKGRRFPINHQDVQQSLAEHKDEFLTQLAQVAAQNFLFGTADRKDEHFIWDLDRHVIFSIDHEIHTTNPIEVTGYFASTLVSYFGDLWYSDAGLRDIFKSSFTAIWDRAKANADPIASLYRNNDLDNFRKDFSKMKTRHSSVLQALLG